MTATRTGIAQRAALGATLAGALVLRSAFVLSAAVPPVTGDAANYDGSAVRLLAKGYFAYATGSIQANTPNAFTMPGFTLFLAALYRVFGVGSGRYLVAYTAQVVVSTLTVGLVYLICRRLTDSPGAGLLAAVVAAIYPPFIVGNGFITTEALFTFALAGVVWLVLFTAERKTPWWFVVTGVGFGLVTLIRPTAVPWILAVVCYLFAKRFGWRRVAVSTAALLLGFVIVLAPWWVRNYRVLHRVVVFNTITANPLFRSTYLYVGERPTYRTEWPARYGQDEFALNDYQGRIAAQRVLWSLEHDPVGFVNGRLDWARAALVTGWALPEGIALAVFTSTLQVVLLLLFWVCPLFYVRKAEVWLVWSMPILLVAVHTVILALPRYIFPAMPFVIVLASAALLAARRRWWGPRGRTAPTTSRAGGSAP